MKVLWITGLPGAGKTTIANQLYSLLDKERDNVVLLDGDNLRKIFADEENYDSASRKTLAKKYAMLCKYLSEQGLIVIIATVSMFHEIRNWNRENIDSYVEIYVKVPFETLAERDQKNLYSKGVKGEVQNVPGIDINIEEPENPDLVLENDGNKSISDLANNIISYI